MREGRTGLGFAAQALRFVVLAAIAQPKTPICPSREATVGSGSSRNLRSRCGGGRRDRQTQPLATWGGSDGMCSAARAASSFSRASWSAPINSPEMTMPWQVSLFDFRIKRAATGFVSPKCGRGKAYRQCYTVLMGPTLRPCASPCLRRALGECGHSKSPVDVEESCRPMFAARFSTEGDRRPVRRPG